MSARPAGGAGRGGPRCWMIKPVWGGWRGSSSGGRPALLLSIVYWHSAELVTTGRGAGRCHLNVRVTPSPVTRWKSPRPIPSLPFLRRLFIADMFVGNFVNTIFWAELPLAHLTPTQDSHRRFYQRVGNTRFCGRHSTGRLWSDWKFQSIEFDFNCCWWNSTFIFLQSQSDTSNSLNPTGRISESHFWTIV